MRWQAHPVTSQKSGTGKIEAAKKEFHARKGSFVSWDVWQTFYCIHVAVWGWPSQVTTHGAGYISCPLLYAPWGGRYGTPAHSSQWRSVAHILAFALIVRPIESIHSYPCGAQYSDPFVSATWCWRAASCGQGKSPPAIHLKTAPLADPLLVSIFKYF